MYRFIDLHVKNKESPADATAAGVSESQRSKVQRRSRRQNLRLTSRGCSARLPAAEVIKNASHARSTSEAEAEAASRDLVSTHSSSTQRFDCAQDRIIVYVIYVLNLIPQTVFFLNIYRLLVCNLSTSPQ